MTERAKTYEEWMMDKAADLLQEKRIEIRQLKQQVKDLEEALRNEQAANA